MPPGHDEEAGVNERATDLEAIERSAVYGWPALETARIDGWLARASSGGSVRANSVSALDYTGRNLADSIAEVAAYYRARGAVPRFTITDVSQPEGLDAALEAEGWRRHGAHVTFAKDVATEPIAPVLSVVRHAEPTPAWYRVYLEGLTGDRRAVAPRLVEDVPTPRAFFSFVRDGEVIGSALTVLDGRLASVQCMATFPAARRTGAASALLAAIEAHAQAHGALRLYLQTDLANTAAMRLYERTGFTIAGHYHTREVIR